MITFTPSVGVAPGTTTMQIDGGSWPEPRGFNPGGELSCRGPLAGLGVCPPGYYSQAAAPLPSGGAAPQGHTITLNPYANETRLNGLRGLRGPKLRWDLMALAAGVSFAGVFAALMLKR